MADTIGLAETIREDILTCPICLEVFDEPKTLPCLHTYCKACLLNVVEIKNKKYRIIRCPECRYESRLVKHGVDDFKSSFFIHSLMEVYNTKRQKVECSVCEKKNTAKDAVSKCITCGDGLCLTCSNGHLQSSMTVLHRVIPLREFVSGMYDEELHNAYLIPCGNHSKQLEYYCSDCEAVCCISCVLLEHKDHMYTSIKRAFEENKVNLETLFKDFQTSMNTVEAAKVKIASLKARANKKSQDVRKIINVTGQKVVAAIGKEIAETKQNADVLIKPKLDKLKELSDDLEKKLKESKSVIEFSKHVLAKGKPVEILQMNGMLKKRIKELSEHCNIDVDEVEFSTQIDDVFINDRFKGDVTVGIFRPDTILTKVNTSDAEAQTELTFVGLPFRPRSEGSPSKKDRSKSAVADDSGIGSLNSSRSSPDRSSTGYGEGGPSRSRSRGKTGQRHVGNSTCASGAQQGGDNRVTGDHIYGSTFDDQADSYEIESENNFAIKEVTILTLSLVLVVVFPLLWASLPSFEMAF